MHRRDIPTTYTEAREMLNPRAERTIANNTRLRLHGSSIGLILHSTEVVTFNADGSIVLNLVAGMREYGFSVEAA